MLSPQTLFKSGERLFDVGYNLGLVGGVLLLMLFYPLRERVKYFQVHPTFAWVKTRFVSSSKTKTAH